MKKMLLVPAHTIMDTVDKELSELDQEMQTILRKSESSEIKLRQYLETLQKFLNMKKQVQPLTVKTISNSPPTNYPPTPPTFSTPTIPPPTSTLPITTSQTMPQLTIPILPITPVSTTPSTAPPLYTAQWVYAILETIHGYSWRRQISNTEKEKYTEKQYGSSLR